MSECAICNGWGVDDTTGFACSSCGTVKQSLMVEPVRSPEELGAAMQTDAEPVAYWYRHPTQMDAEPFGTLRLTDADKADGWTETPLYAHPPVAAPALKSAVEVWREASDAATDGSVKYQSHADQAAAAVIEADRAAIIAAKDAEIAALREALKAERLKPCRHTQTAEGETQRPDIHAWQEAQSEWFNPTILEIVAEYAAHRDQTDGLAALQVHADALAKYAVHQPDCRIGKPDCLGEEELCTCGLSNAIRAYEEFRCD